MEPCLVSVRRVNRPCTGSESTIVVATGVALPWAQSGTQPNMSDVPCPTASVESQEDQVMPVTMFVASPEM